MTNSPLISIITPSFNAASYIERALTNVVAQEVASLEHIVVDGGSKDRTIDILRRYRAVRWISEPDTGQADALNKGFRMARGEIIGWLNGDDTYTPGAIRVGMDYLRAHPECDIVYGDCNILRENGSLLTVFRPRQMDGYEKLLGGAIHTPAVFFRRDLLDRVGYLDQSLHYALDTEFWLRAAPLSQQTYLPEVLANFHHQPGSKSTTVSAAFGPELCRIYESAFSQEPYRSQIPLEVRQEILARYFWSCGINLTLAGSPDRAEPYLYKALDCYGIMGHPGIVTECAITRYVERDVLSWGELEALVAALPVEQVIRNQVWAWIKRDYQELRFYAAYNRNDWSEMRHSGFQVAFQRPRRLLRRGFLSIWAESFLGSQLMGFIRQLI